ncbi:MAG: hypothetical protein ACK4IS_07335 [Erythrobacter sp.]
MTDRTAPLLDIETLIIRPAIMIDGERHEIIAPDELPLDQSHLMAAKGRRMQQLQQADSMNRDQRAELEAIVEQLSDIIMEPIPKAVRGKLKPAQRLQVIEAFTALLLKRRMASAAAMMPGQKMIEAAMQAMGAAARPSPGESSSPGSSDSSAETPKAG